MTVYVNYRECLERAQPSRLFVRCARIISTTYNSIYSKVKTLTPDDVANTSCQ